MLVEVLSEHPGAVARTTQRQIEDQYRRIGEHDRAVAALREHHGGSRRWWQLGKRLSQQRELWELAARTPVVDPQAEYRLARQRGWCRRGRADDPGLATTL
ncbi:MAG: hypothetical protein ACRDQG_04690 [Pseudonocardiaceae bacterium]